MNNYSCMIGYKNKLGINKCKNNKHLISNNKHILIINFRIINIRININNNQINNRRIISNQIYNNRKVFIVISIINNMDIKIIKMIIILINKISTKIDCQIYYDSFYF